MKETIQYRHTPNKVAPQELLRKLRAQERKEEGGKPLAFNEILRRSKGGFLRHRFGRRD